MTESIQSLYIVIGMPGSGKTTYLEHLLSDGVIDCFIDDYQHGAPKDETTGRRKSDPHLSENYAALSQAMDAGKDVAIADIRYCAAEEQAFVERFAAEEFPEANVILTYFANDPEACRHNVRVRNRVDNLQRELDNIDLLTTLYNPPQNRVLPVIMG